MVADVAGYLLCPQDEDDARGEGADEDEVHAADSDDIRHNLYSKNEQLGGEKRDIRKVNIFDVILNIFECDFQRSN